MRGLPITLGSESWRNAVSAMPNGCGGSIDTVPPMYICGSGPSTRRSGFTAMSTFEMYVYGRWFTSSDRSARLDRMPGSCM